VPFFAFGWQQPTRTHAVPLSAATHASTSCVTVCGRDVRIEQHCCNAHYCKRLSCERDATCDAHLLATFFLGLTRFRKSGDLHICRSAGELDAKGGDMCAHGTGSTHMATDACTPIASFETSPKARMGQPAPTHCSVEFELAGEERERNDALADAEACTTGGLAHCEVSVPELAADARTTTPSSVGSSVDSIAEGLYDIRCDMTLGAEAAAAAGEAVAADVAQSSSDAELREFAQQTRQLPSPSSAASDESPRIN
jgi:hypothetical protein